MKINAEGLHFKILNDKIKDTKAKDIVIDNCLGQRYIGSGMSGKDIVINGTPGNALGAYLDGSSITVNGNAQDATGDTMNDGTVYIHGSSGDATGYAMRGGKIFVKGDTGYRAGIHMKAYENKQPVIVVGGCAGSFLGEYQAGGKIVVLGINKGGEPPVSNFCGTGMHGGKIFLRCDYAPDNLPVQVTSSRATSADLKEIEEEVKEYCNVFGEDYDRLMSNTFFILTPNTKNPYKQLYTQN